MKTCFLLASLLLATGEGRTAAQGVSVTFDKTADFSKYKTYRWVGIKSAQQLDELTDAQLVSTLDVELSKKGLTKSLSDQVDLFIGYQIVTRNKKHLSNANIGLAGASGPGGSTSAATATTTVHSGQLVLDMYEPAPGKLVWRGVVSNSIDADAKPDKKQKHMDKAIEKLLRDYPPRKKP